MALWKKTGALEKLTDKMAGAFKGKERGFVILTVILFVVLSSVTGLIIPLFALVPLFAAVLFAMNYDKLTVMASTVGSLLVGSIASTYGFNITGYTKNLLGLDMNNQIVAKIILLVVLVVALIFIILTSSKRTTNKDVKEAKVNKDKKEVKDTKEDKKATKSSNSKKAKKPASKTTAKKTSSKTTGKKASKSTTKAFAVF